MSRFLRCPMAFQDEVSPRRSRLAPSDPDFPAIRMDDITSPGPLRRRVRPAVFALLACAVIMLAGACERSDDPEETPGDEYEIRATIPGDSAAPVAGSVRRVPAPPVVGSVRRVPAPPPGEVTAAESDATADPDAPLFATTAELRQLSAGLVVPVQGVARSELRDTYEEARGDRVHEALDIMAPRGTPVLSAADGRVLRLFDSRPGGLMVYAADPSDRFILFYGHLDGYAEGLSDGMPLVRGQVIGYVGTTGNAASNAPHLHFGILRGNPGVAWSEGMPLNPYPLFVPEAAGR